MRRFTSLEQKRL